MVAISIKNARDRRIKALFDARQQACVNLAADIPVAFHISEMTNKSDEAWKSQWVPHSNRMPPDGGWNWPDYRTAITYSVDEFSMAIWTEDESRLSALAVGKLTTKAVRLKAIERDPRPDCPLSGCALLIILEAATLYAQAMGREQVHLVDPVNQALVDLYENAYGFKCVNVGRTEAYCWKEV